MTRRFPRALMLPLAVTVLSTIVGCGGSGEAEEEVGQRKKDAPQETQVARASENPAPAPNDNPQAQNSPAPPQNGAGGYPGAPGGGNRPGGYPGAPGGGNRPGGNQPGGYPGALGGGNQPGGNQPGGYPGAPGGGNQPGGNQPGGYPGAPGGDQPQGSSGNDGERPNLKRIMTMIGKGPNALTPVLERELKEDPPNWETIQAQTKDYARFASAMGSQKAPRGPADSWTKLTSAFADSAKELDDAAQAKNKEAAVAAHFEVANSCMSCHRVHRPMRGGGGVPVGGFRPGGPGI